MIIVKIDSPSLSNEKHLNVNSKDPSHGPNN